MTSDEAYGHCERLTKRAARNFAWGLQLLPTPKRRALSAVYAWCRRCDDAVDDFTGPEARTRLERERATYLAATGPTALDSDDPVQIALHSAIKTFALPPEPFEQLLQGMAMDLGSTHFRTFDQLVGYCDHVAGTVGELCVRIFGFQDPLAIPLAHDLGIALQLTNILRDVKEDALRRRIYLPIDELVQFGSSPDDVWQGRLTPGLEAVVRSQIERAEAYYRRALPLFAMVSADALSCLSALAGIYRTLLERMAAGSYNPFGPRVQLSTREKLQLIGGLVWRPKLGENVHG